MTDHASVLVLPTYLAEAIEWVLRPSRDSRSSSLPDLSRLTSDQMQLLPLPVAQDFMALMLDARERPPARPKPVEAPPARMQGGQKGRSLPQPSVEDQEQRAPTLNELYSTRGAPNATKQWPGRFEGRSRQLARRDRQRAQALVAAHERLLAWYVQTASAGHRGFKR
jgi:hypothetical protein